MQRFMDVAFDPEQGLGYEAPELSGGDHPGGWGIWGWHSFRNWYFAMHEEGFVDHYQRVKTKGLLNPRHVV